MAEQILLEKKDGVAVLRINRPEALNALSRSIIDRMDVLLEQVKNDPEIHVLLVYSETNFAAGADIKDMSYCGEEEAKAFIFSPTYRKLQELSIPTIAVMEGYALGGGLELALRCDLRLAAKSAKLGLTELNVGIIPGAGGTVLLPRLVGEAKAKELIYFSRIVSGEEAETIGLVNLAVDDDKLWETAEMWVKKLQRKSSVTLAAAKDCITFGENTADEQMAIDHEATVWAGLFRSFDQKEGMQAFLEKRHPKFQGR